MGARHAGDGADPVVGGARRRGDVDADAGADERVDGVPELVARLVRLASNPLLCDENVEPRPAPQDGARAPGAPRSPER